MIKEDLIKPFFQKDIPKDIFYDKALNVNDELTNHSDEEKYPKKVLEVARPNEDEKYKIYRETVWSPITYTYYEKVLNTIAKIRRAEDWEIKYPEKTGAIKEDESLYNYCEVKYPYFGSISNWFFTLAINTFIEDPNAVFAIYPEDEKLPDNDYIKPYANIYRCDQVIKFKSNEFACLLSDDKSVVGLGQQKVMEGNIFYFFDKLTMEVWEQYGQKEDYTFQITRTVDHKLGYLPVYKFGGKIKTFKEGDILYGSFISACLPFWKEAIRRYSDHQVNMVLHLHPDRWEIEDTPCPICKGEGKTYAMNGNKKVPSNCTKCSGSGSLIFKSPFGVKVIKATQTQGVNNSVVTQTPPMGNVPRDIESLSFLKDEYKDDVRDGLSALNMEFLMDYPADTSGISKAYDADGVNSFFHSMARHIVQNILSNVYKTSNDYRYPTVKARDKNLPAINVPEKFDLASSSILAERLKIAKNAEFNARLNTSLQIKFAKKEFGEDSIDAKIINIVDLLDPLSNITDENKMLILTNGGCTQEDYILSCKISPYVQRAIIKIPNFLDLDYDSQMVILNGFVDEVVKKNKSRDAALPQVDEFGNPI